MVERDEMIEIELEERRERDRELSEGRLTASQEDIINEDNRIECEMCKKKFDETEMDLCKIEGGENMWLCHDCNEHLESFRDEPSWEEIEAGEIGK